MEKQKTVGEQIADLEAARAAKTAQLETVTRKSIDEGRSMDEAEAEEFDSLEAEVKTIDEDLVRLRKLEKLNAAKAVPAKGDTSEDAGKSRAGVHIEVKANVPKGTAFTRYAIALARSKGNLLQAAEIAKGWHDQTPEVETVLRSAVAAGTTNDSTWAAPLIEYQTMASEFIDLLRPATIIGKIQGLRRVPFNVKIPGQTGASSVGWVGEGKPKPVSALAFNTTTLGFAKVAGIVVLTDELVRFSTPSAEALVRTDLVASITQFLDHDFVDPGKAASAGVSPASITNGLTPVTASGTDAAALRTDVQALFRKFISANLSVAGAVWIMPSTVALTIGLMQNALGQPEFPGIDMNGGTLFGLPVITSENIPANAGSGSPLTGDGARIVLVKASEVLLADDGGVTLDASREASLQLDGAPSAGAQELVSLWQNNMVALRAEREINWARRRADAVAYIDSAKYVA